MIDVTGYKTCIRRARLSELLPEKDLWTVKEISRRMNVSTATIYNDLKVLGKTDLIDRRRGAHALSEEQMQRKKERISATRSGDGPISLSNVREVLDLRYRGFSFDAIGQLFNTNAHFIRRVINGDWPEYLKKQAGEDM
jgi:DNA-binding transcriptional regulator YhcF (GntR family)